MPSRNVVSWTALISGYVEVKKMSIAIELFEKMPVKNHVTWCVMLGGFVDCRKFGEAFVFFSKMLSSGVRATVATIMEVISCCSFMGNLKQGCKIHGYVIKLGFHLDQMIEASLVSMYCDCLGMEEAEFEFRKMEIKCIGSWNSMLCGYTNNSNYNINYAQRFFDSMVNRDNLSWNLMINGYLKHNRIDDAVKLFWMMPEPTMESFTALMYSYIKNGNLDDAEKLFYMMPKRDVVAYTTLVFGYLRIGQLENAFELFNKMPERNVVSYNVMISGLLHSGKTKEAYDLFKMSPVKDIVSWDNIIAGFVQNGLFAEAINLFKNMSLSDIKPSELITASLLRASARLSISMHGEQFHGIAVKLGHECCLIVGNSLINMYGKCGNILMAKFVFDQMTEHDVVAWNAIINSYACNGLGKEAILMFEEMKMCKIKPDYVTFLGILVACNHNCLCEEAQGYFDSMVCDYGINPTVAHYSCLIDLLCRMGMAEKAEDLAHSMPFETDSTVWASILNGCRLHGNVKLAEHAANQLFLWDPLDRMPYKHLISIYESAGRWADVERMRSKMNELTSNTRAGYSWV
ncbi:pentatricopeptide repeat-containing protein At4g02750-like isoform X2 [Phalaenopsis equestris]|nr:pentatricopeptide repeat-containing protein At4g02750-like isoform X2 [Phalaenopsis equestris]